MMNESFEEAYEQFGKQEVQKTLIGALTDNYDAIEESFLEYLKEQFTAQIKAEPINERARLDQKYCVNQNIYPAYLYLVFCVSCNLSGCTRYQAKFTELLQAKYGKSPQRASR